MKNSSAVLLFATDLERVKCLKICPVCIILSIYLFSVLVVLLVLVTVAFDATDFFRLTAGDSVNVLILTFAVPTLVSGIFGDIVVL